MKQKQKVIYEKCLFIDEYRKTFNINMICKYIKISKQTYYSWCNSGKISYLNKLKFNLDILNKIKELFYQNKELYGAPRIYILLKKLGYQVTIRIVQKYMKFLNIKSKIRKKINFYKNYLPCEKISHSDDLVKRKFNPSAKNKIWVTDITEIKINNKTIYISSVQDLYNREIIGTAVRLYKGYKLIEESFLKAVNNSSLKHSDNVIIHSDNGAEYKSYNWMLLTMSLNARISMSRVGNCLDNAVIESFHAILKTEGLKRKYSTFTEFSYDYTNFINWYNKERIITKFGCAPIDRV